MRILQGAMCAAALFASAAAAQTQDRLAPLAFFQGCWHGVFSGSNAVVDERCLRPMLGGTYVRDTHEVRGAPEPYAGEAIYAYDPQAHRIAVTYYASDGGVERGFAVADGQALVFPPNHFVGADGEVLTLRARWTPDGPDRYVAVSEMLVHGRWREHLRITYTRASATR